MIQLAEKRRRLVQQAEKRRRLMQQTEKRHCVFAWSLVHQAEKRRCCFLPRPSASSLTASNLEQQAEKRRCCPLRRGSICSLPLPQSPQMLELEEAHGGTAKKNMMMRLMLTRLRYAVFPFDRLVLVLDQLSCILPLGARCPLNLALSVEPSQEVQPPGPRR